ncbi:MAG: hypothetical protein EZS28_015558, partial [Streblomastix strix]
MGAGNSRVVEESLVKLKTEVVSNPVFMDQFFSYVENDEDLQIVTHEDVREIMLAQPGNIRGLILHIIDFLDSFSRSVEVEQIKKAKSGIKVLTRIMAVILEPENSNLCKNIFWESWKDSESILIGKYMLHLIMRMMFLPLFTVEQKVKNSFRGIERHRELKWDLLWEGGLCVSRLKPAPTEILDNRIHLIRLILVLASSQLYYPISESTERADRFMDELSSDDLPFREEFALSLMNSVFIDGNSSMATARDGYGRYWEECVKLLNILVEHPFYRRLIEKQQIERQQREMKEKEEKEKKQQEQQQQEEKNEQEKIEIMKRKQEQFILMQQQMQKKAENFASLSSASSVLENKKGKDVMILKRNKESIYCSKQHLPYLEPKQLQPLRYITHSIITLLSYPMNYERKRILPVQLSVPGPLNLKIPISQNLSEQSNSSQQVSGNGSFQLKWNVQNRICDNIIALLVLIWKLLSDGGKESEVKKEERERERIREIEKEEKNKENKENKEKDINKDIKVNWIKDVEKDEGEKPLRTFLDQLLEDKQYTQEFVLSIIFYINSTLFSLKPKMLLMQEKVGLMEDHAHSHQHDHDEQNKDNEEQKKEQKKDQKKEQKKEEQIKEDLKDEKERIVDPCIGDQYIFTLIHLYRELSGLSALEEEIADGAFELAEVAKIRKKIHDIEQKKEKEQQKGKGKKKNKDNKQEEEIQYQGWEEQLQQTRGSLTAAMLIECAEDRGNICNTVLM